MIIDFIEIGTADFGTLIQECAEHEKGISIEPIKKYIDRLPNKENVIKINAAIVDDSSIKTIDTYYVEESIINEHNLGGWLKGCNSVGKPHDFHIGYYPHPGIWHNNVNRASLPKINLLHMGLVSIVKVDCYTFGEIMDKYKIEYVNFVKIDTEGQDSKIINSIIDYYESSNKKLPKKILFETNAHNNEEDVNIVCKRLSQIGYKMNGWNGQSFDAINKHDCLAELCSY